VNKTVFEQWMECTVTQDSLDLIRDRELNLDPFFSMLNSVNLAGIGQLQMLLTIVESMTSAWRGPYLM